MWKYLLVAVVATLLLDSYLINFLAPILLAGHKLCLKMFQPQESFRPYYELLVCAERPAKSSSKIDPDFYQHLRVFAVSGLQFLFVERILAKLFGNTLRWRTQLLLFFFSAALTFFCGLNPTILRAWMSLLTKKVVRFERLNWPSALTSFVAGVLCLAVKPEWFLSLPFYICWVAALVMQIPRRPLWQRATLASLALTPFGAVPDPQHLLPSLLDALLKPIVILFLFPVSLAVGAAPRIAAVGNSLWQASFWLFHFIDSSVGAPVDTASLALTDQPSSHLAPYLALGYAVALHAGLYAYDSVERQSRFWPGE